MSDILAELAQPFPNTSIDPSGPRVTVSDLVKTKSSVTPDINQSPQLPVSSVTIQPVAVVGGNVVESGVGGQFSSNPLPLLNFISKE